MNPNEERWFEYYEASVANTYVCGYIIPSTDEEVVSGKIYYAGPFEVA